MCNRIYGKQYDEKLTIKEIAAKVRDFVKQEFPGFKFSVTSCRRGGRSISVYLTACPDDFKFYQAQIGLRPISSEAYSALCKKITAFANEYNYNGSDVQADYWDVGFYLFIKDGEEIQDQVNREYQSLIATDLQGEAA